jgi:hypothetical protein
MTPLKDISSHASREWRITATASETFLWSENSIKGKLLPPGKVKKKTIHTSKRASLKEAK